MNEKYNVIIVDDEYLAQKLLQDYVSKVEQLQLVATCSNAFEAMEALKSNAVDIMLLDIQMPDLTGLELVKSLDKKPAVIFTTAFPAFLPSHQQGHRASASEDRKRSEARCRHHQPLQRLHHREGRLQVVQNQL